MTLKELWSIMRRRQTNFRWANASWTYYPNGDPAGKPYRKELQIMYASPEAVLNSQWNAAQEASITEQARRAPHVLMRPVLLQDGTMWCALFGENIQEGVAGFGETPAKAMEAFDEAWMKGLTPAAIRAAHPR